MAGDWIKMRTGLRDDPAVFRLAEALGVSELHVFGALYCFWSWVDAHAVDGRVDGVASRVVDSVSRTPGFADALVAVGWLQIDGTGLQIPRYERHNGESAKERGLKNARQARWRDRVQGLVDAPPSTPTSTPASTREEKSREEKSRTTSQPVESKSTVGVEGRVRPRKRVRTPAHTHTRGTAQEPAQQPEVAPTDAATRAAADQRHPAAAPSLPEPRTSHEREPLATVVAAAPEKRATARKSEPAEFVLPDWIDRDMWDAWHSTPKRRKATPQQKEFAVRKLSRWRDEGVDWRQALENAVVAGWQGLFAPDGGARNARAAPERESFRERDARLARERIEQFAPGLAERAPAGPDTIDAPTPPTTLLQ